VVQRALVRRDSTGANRDREHASAEARMGAFMLGATDQRVAPENERRRPAVPTPFAKHHGVPPVRRLEELLSSLIEGRVKISSLTLTWSRRRQVIVCTPNCP
jgi:hypothetical protein